MEFSFIVNVVKIVDGVGEDSCWIYIVSRVDIRVSSIFVISRIFFRIIGLYIILNEVGI